MAGLDEPSIYVNTSTCTPRPPTHPTNTHAHIPPMHSAVLRHTDPPVLGLLGVVVVRRAVVVDVHVLEQRVRLDGAEDVGLVFLGQIDGFGVASSFEVEDAVGIPPVLVVADEVACGVGGQGGLAGAAESWGCYVNAQPTGQQNQVKERMCNEASQMRASVLTEEKGRVAVFAHVG